MEVIATYMNDAGKLYPVLPGGSWLAYSNQLVFLIMLLFACDIFVVEDEHCDRRFKFFLTELFFFCLSVKELGQYGSSCVVGSCTEVICIYAVRSYLLRTGNGRILPRL